MRNTIVHFEIPANDVEKLKGFYESLFDWKISKTPGDMEYWMIETVPMNEQGKPEEPGINGGMIKKQGPEHMGINYILVASVDEYAKKAEELGAKTIVPKKEVPGMGSFVVIMDPDGNAFGIWEETKKE